MSKVIAALSMSLDGFVAGPDPSLKDPLGIGGEQLHEWLFAEPNADSEIVDRLRANVGAGVMGRKMYSGGSGAWEDDPRDRGWWGEDPPFHHHVFVLTRHPREPLVMHGGTTFSFVTDGIESALEQARTAAGGKDVQIHGGGSAMSQYLAAGLLDELTITFAPVLLGSGTRLLQDVPPGQLERTRVTESPSGVIHVEYSVRE